jgi:hypothetical protein
MFMQDWSRGRALALALGVATLASVAHADSYSPVGSHVTQVASSQLYKQNAIIFKIDQGTADCPAGAYIYYYSSNPDDLKAMYASVLGAYLASATVIVHFPTSGSCVADNLGIGSY